MIALDLSGIFGFSHHRSGWKYACGGLKRFHSKNGIYCDTFIEKTFLWELGNYYSSIETSSKLIPYKNNWIGIIHNPPNVPEWFDNYHTPQSLLDKKVFQESLQSCLCIITLSKYLKDWLEKQTTTPIIEVKHPTPLNVPKWSVDKFLKQKYIPIVQIGYWLRNVTLIRDIFCSSRYTKIWLPSSYDQAMYLLNLHNRIDSVSKELQYRWNGIAIPNKISNEEYDELMTGAIVCLELYDSSANNAIIECIARNTPIVVNKITPVVEYLGEDYPLYFSHRDEVSSMVSDIDLIIKAHKYLKDMDKSFLSVTKFAMDLNDKLEEII